MLNIIVVGGGLGGLSAAIALSRSGHNVTLLEAQPSFSELGAGIQMPPNSTKIMQDWGLLDLVQSKAAMPEFMRFLSYRDGEVLHELQLWPDMEMKFGTPHLLIHRREILNILLDEARKLKVTLRVNSQVTRIDLSVPSITTAAGDVLTAQIIIGADGERSFCRSTILGRPHTLCATGKLVYRFTLDLDFVRGNSELGHLVNPPAVSCWIGPRSHIVAYELPSDGIFNVSLTCPDPVEGRVQLGPREADLDELRRCFAQWDPTFVKLLEFAAHTRFWTLVQLPEENRVWIDDEAQRTILIGDAAHAMQPYLAQGASQSIEDGAFLGHLLPKNTSEDSIPMRLKIFCERRQARALLARDQAQKIGCVLEMEDGPSQEERDSHMRGNVANEGFPNPYADPTVQQWLYTYDVKADVDAAMRNI